MSKKHLTGGHRVVSLFADVSRNVSCQSFLENVARKLEVVLSAVQLATGNHHAAVSRGCDGGACSRAALTRRRAALGPWSVMIPNVAH
eukprot:scaffold55_cov235-Chaetoceros_neogracile.AAC.1